MDSTHCGQVDEVIRKTDEMLRKCLGQTRQMIGDIINMEMAYINVHHPDFIGTQGAIRRLMSQKGMSYQDTKATLEAEDARRKEAARTGQSFEGTLNNVKNKVKHGYLQKR